jgi:hypothetical protein
MLLDFVFKTIFKKRGKKKIKGNDGSLDSSTYLDAVRRRLHLNGPR